ncbi:MAG: type II secretion system F family protein [Syntrophomonadaceae bacterium]|nr:type II secretion system F family protein [Syntrophomonadaceae bacterium]
MMEIIISVLTFLTVVFLVIGLNLVRIREQEHISMRLDNIAKEFKEDSVGKGIIRPKLDVSSILSAMGKSFVNLSFTKRLENELTKADLMLRVEEFIGLNILSAVACGLIGLLLFGEGSPILILALIGALTPAFVVYRKKRARAELLNSEIGESLTGMSNSLRAGYSFQQAMDLVSKETAGPLAIEYRRTLREINLGMTTEQALQNLIQRGDNEDLELMIGAVLIQRQIGGNLAEIFDNIADTIRQRIRMQGEVKTLTAQGRISGIVIGLLPVILLAILMIIDSSYINVLLGSRIGWMILIGASISELIGFIFMRKITDIEF